jgi:hypothetical protein
MASLMLSDPDDTYPAHKFGRVRRQAQGMDPPSSSRGGFKSNSFDDDYDDVDLPFVDKHPGDDVRGPGTPDDEKLPNFDFDDFHDSVVINNQLRKWFDEHRDIVRLDLRGVSPHEGGRIYRIRLGEFGAFKKSRKPTIFIEAGKTNSFTLD